MYTVFAQDDVLLFDHLTRALCRNKVDMVQLLAEIIEALEGNLSRFIKDQLMQLYIEVRNYEITKRILKHLGFLRSHSGDVLMGNITFLTTSAVFDLSQLTILINCTLSASHIGFYWRPLKMRLRPLQFDKHCGQ